jgi:hypothetical protein
MHDNLDDFHFNLQDNVESLYRKYWQVEGVSQQEQARVLSILKLD